MTLTLGRRPPDLDAVQRHLAITARHLPELPRGPHGNLQAALTPSHLGHQGRRLARREIDRSAGLICPHYAALKVKRGAEAGAATRAPNAESPGR